MTRHKLGSHGSHGPGIILPPAFYGGYRRVKKTRKATEACEFLPDEDTGCTTMMGLGVLQPEGLQIIHRISRHPIPISRFWCPRSMDHFGGSPIQWHTCHGAFFPSACCSGKQVPMAGSIPMTTKASTKHPNSPSTMA